MRKILFVLFGLIILSSFAFEDVPILTHDMGIDVRYVNMDDYDINIDNLKAKNRIKKAQKEAIKLNRPKIEVDTKQLNYQRALDYTTRQNNSIFLPRF